MRPTAKDPSQFEFPVGPKVPYEDPKRCVSLRAATKREACKSTKLCTKQGHGWKLFISGTPTKRTLLLSHLHSCDQMGLDILSIITGSVELVRCLSNPD